MDRRVGTRSTLCEPASVSETGSSLRRVRTRTPRRPRSSRPSTCGRLRDTTNGQWVRRLRLGGLGLAESRSNVWTSRRHHAERSSCALAYCGGAKQRNSQTTTPSASSSASRGCLGTKCRGYRGASSGSRFHSESDVGVDGGRPEHAHVVRGCCGHSSRAQSHGRQRRRSGQSTDDAPRDTSNEHLAPVGRGPKHAERGQPSCVA